eukprot:6198084-Pleurochrysis_carterae.AAC.5
MSSPLAYATRHRFSTAFSCFLGIRSCGPGRLHRSLVCIHPSIVGRTSPCRSLRHCTHARTASRRLLSGGARDVRASLAPSLDFLAGPHVSRQLPDGEGAIFPPRFRIDRVSKPARWGGPIRRISLSGFFGANPCAVPVHARAVKATRGAPWRTPGAPSRTHTRPPRQCVGRWPAKEHPMPEGFNRTIVCNVPWVAAQFWGTAKRFFPKRDADRVKARARTHRGRPTRASCAAAVSAPAHTKPHAH